MYFEAGYTPETLAPDSVDILKDFFCEFHGLNKVPKNFKKLSLEEFYEGFLIDYGPVEQAQNKEDNELPQFNITKKENKEELEDNSAYFHQMSFDDYNYNSEGYIDYEDFE